MDVFESLLKLILDEKSLANIKSKVNKELKIKVGADTSKAKTDVDKIASELSRLSKTNTMQSWYDNNTKATKQMRAEVGKLIAEMGNLDKPITMKRSSEITARFKEIQYQARVTGKIGKSAADKFKTAWEKFGGWGIATGTFMKLKTEVIDGIKFIGKLDDALTDVTYTSNISKAGLEELGNSSIKMAKDLNASAENVLEAVKIYSTAKASADDILRKAKPAIMLSNISGMSGSESSKTINTALNQFGLEDTEEQLLDITDTLQYVSSQLNYDFTEGIKQITEGIEASGSVAKNAGLNMQEYAAMVGVAVEQTGQSGSTIGNAYKTIFSRITKASEIEGTLGEDISNAEEALRGIGVQVRSANNDFRDMTDIMADIGSKWNELNDVQKAKVGYEVAGIRQLNVLNSLFGSWQSYSDIIADVDKRTGTTLENQEKYAESLQGHLGDIKATTQSIWNNIFDTGDFKSALSGFNDLLGLVEKITDKLGTWGTLAAGIGMWQGIKNAGVFKADNLKSWFGGNKNIAQPFANAEQVIWKYNQAIAHNSLTQQGWERILAQSDDGLKAYLTSIKGTTATTTAYTTSLNSNFMGLKNVASAISQYNSLATKGATEQQGLVNVINATNSSLGGYLSGLNGANASLAGYGMSLLGATAKTIGLTAASMALNAVLSMGISVAIQAAIAGIAALGKWMDDLIVTDAELSEKIKDVDTKWKELSSTIQNSAKAFQDLKAQADDIIPRYAKLSQGVDKYGNNISLTDEEFKEFVSLNNQLGQMFPELVTGYASNGSAILALSGNVDTLTESLYACVEAQRLAAAQEIADTMPDIVEGDNGIVESVKLYEEEIKRKREALDEWNEYVKHHRDSLYKDGTKIEDRFIEEDVIALAEQLDVEREQIQHLIEYVEDDKYSGHFNADKVFDSNVMKNAVAGYEKAIDDIQKRIESKWKQLNPVISAWLSTDFLYQDLDVDGQNIISSLIGELDFKSLGLKTSEDIQDYISNNIISPIYDMDADAQKAFFEIFDIQEAVKKGEMTVDEFDKKLIEILSKGNFSEEFKNLFKEAFGDVEEYVQSSTFLNKMTVSLSALEKASDKISKLGSAFKELSDDGYITTKTLGEIQAATGLSGDEWTEYENKLLNVKRGSSEFKQILSDLTYKILENEFATIGLENVTEEQIAAILRENGVINANAVAHDVSTNAKARAKLASFDFTKATDAEVDALYEELKAFGFTEIEIKDLATVYASAQKAMLDAVESGAAGRLGILKSELEGITGIAEAYALLSKNGAPSYDPTGKGNAYVGSELSRMTDEQYAAYLADREKVIAYGNAVEALKKIQDIDITIPNYSGNGKSGSDKNKPDYEDPTDAIINRINLRAKELEQQEESIQNAIEIAELENDYKKQISLTNDKLATQKQRVDALKMANDELHQKAEDLRNGTPQWNEDEWFDSQGNATEAYNTLYNNSSKEEQEKIKDQFEKISKIKEAWVANDEERLSLAKEILQTEEEIVNLDFEHSQNWIDDRNTYNDWALFNDSEIEAWERVIKRLKEDYNGLAGAAEKLKEAEESLFEARKEQFNKTTDFASSYWDSQKTLLQSHYDVTNSIAEAQHEINKELEASMTMYAYLDEETRKLLFNQEDYNKLSQELSEIQDESLRLKTEYEQALDNATLNTIEEITSNYEMQYETLMKSYEIAKAELEVAKKRKQLDNVLAEKNVRMLINGQWQWVAKTQDVIDAQSELADAEYEAEQARLGKKQTDSINALTAKQDHLGTVIGEFENGVIDLDSAIYEVTRMFRDLPRAMQNSISQIDPNFTYSSGRSSGYAEFNGAKFYGIPDDLLPSGAIKHYATGTKHALPGLAEINENKKLEGIITRNGTLIPMANFGGGEMVFNHEMMENLWHQAQIPWNIPSVSVPDFISRTPSSGQSIVYDIHDFEVNPTDVDSFVQDLSARARSYNAITSKMK